MAEVGTGVRRRWERGGGGTDDGSSAVAEIYAGISDRWNAALWARFSAPRSFVELLLFHVQWKKSP